MRIVVGACRPRVGQRVAREKTVPRSGGRRGRISAAPPEVGWRGVRIIGLVIGESLICAIAAALGTVLGILASRSALTLTSVGGLLEPQYNPAIFVQAVIVAVAVALVGAAYPSFRAVRLTPMEALRHE